VDLAAGLDARPWRLPLPPSLRWADVDLPEMLSYKTETLRDAAPVFRYEAASADLTDASARAALFARLGAEGRNALVVTEGLLIYLSAEQVGALARDLHAVPSFRWWLIDLASPALLQIMTRMWGRSVRDANAPFRFAPAEGTAFFRQFGWREVQFRSAMHEARRLRREMRMMWLWRSLARFRSRAKREEIQRLSGIVLLERA
jgi:O-methyltransferase involved in polyketide biosynthesis